MVSDGKWLTDGWINLVLIFDWWLLIRHRKSFFLVDPTIPACLLTKSLCTTAILYYTVLYTILYYCNKFIQIKSNQIRRHADWLINDRSRSTNHWPTEHQFASGVNFNQSCAQCVQYGWAVLYVDDIYGKYFRNAADLEGCVVVCSLRIAFICLSPKMQNASCCLLLLYSTKKQHSINDYTTSPII